MKTLYSDLRVELRKMTVHGSSFSSSEGTTSKTHSNHQREKSIFIGLDVYGTTRVSGSVGQWQMSGLIPPTLILADGCVVTRHIPFRPSLG